MNEYIMHDKYAEIVIDSKKWGRHLSKIDLEDVDKCKNITWSINGHGNKKANQEPILYVCNSTFGLLHSFLIGKKDGFEIDHKNLNTLDNRKRNLRHVSHSQNQLNKRLYKNNSSGTTGVMWVEKFNRWVAYIKRNGKNTTLGHYTDFDMAVRSRKRAEKLFNE
jgi:hypothetical protein